jgi:hypothetical protein
VTDHHELIAGLQRKGPGSNVVSVQGECPYPSARQLHHPVCGDPRGMERSADPGEEDWPLGIEPRGFGPSKDLRHDAGHRFELMVVGEGLHVRCLRSGCDRRFARFKREAFIQPAGHAARHCNVARRNRSRKAYRRAIAPSWIR